MLLASYFPITYLVRFVYDQRIKVSKSEQIRKLQKGGGVLLYIEGKP